MEPETPDRKLSAVLSADVYGEGAAALLLGLLILVQQKNAAFGVVEMAVAQLAACWALVGQAQQEIAAAVLPQEEGALSGLTLLSSPFLPRSGNSGPP